MEENFKNEDIIKRTIMFAESFRRNLNDYKSTYSIRVNEFKDKYVDNTEIVFIENEIERVNDVIMRLNVAIKQSEEQIEITDQSILDYNPLEEFYKDIRVDSATKSKSTYKLIIDFLESRKQEIEKESKLNAPAPELVNNDFKKYKNQNLFKVGLLFATGEMNKYFQVNSLNKIVLNPGYNAPSIAKELNNSVNDKYILAAINNYESNKNIFNSLDMMNKVISHCKEENLPIDAYFNKCFVEYKKQY
jgi:hypothetical protein